MDDNEVPYQYLTNISDWSNYVNNSSFIPRCTATSTKNTRKTLYSSTPIPYTDRACIANTHNVGNYYNYAAATAGSDTHLATLTAPTDTSNSICPKGWQLPPNAGNKSYNTLIHTAYNISSTTSDSEVLALPLSFTRLGMYQYLYASLVNRGIIGYYWNSSSYSLSHSFYLRFNSNELNFQYGSDRAHGFPIRCVSR